MKLHRASIRSMMLVIALLGLVFGLVIPMHRRATDFRSKSNDHRLRQVVMEQGFGVGTAPAEYHRAMAAKYDRAARYPWLPVEPDAPR